VALAAREQHVRGQLDREARGASVARHLAVRALFVAGFEAALRAVKGVARDGRAALGQLAPLLHLITEVQLELGFANITTSRNDNHELLSKYFSWRLTLGQICANTFVRLPARQPRSVLPARCDRRRAHARFVSLESTLKGWL
jgi:hypothetical protein